MLNNEETLALFNWIRDAAASIDLVSEQIQRVGNDANTRVQFIAEATSLLEKYFTRSNWYDADQTCQRVCSCPRSKALSGRVRSIDSQVIALQRALAGCRADKEYVQMRQAAPSPEGFVKVVVPKLQYFQQGVSAQASSSGLPWNVGRHINALDQVLHLLAATRYFYWQRHAGEFPRIRFNAHEETLQRRLEDEAQAPGDVLVLDVYLSNFLGNERIHHSPRWSRNQCLLSGSCMGLSALDGAWILFLNPTLQNATKDIDWEYCLEQPLVEGKGNEEGTSGSVLCSGYYDNGLQFFYQNDSFPALLSTTPIAIRPGHTWRPDRFVPGLSG